MRPIHPSILLGKDSWTNEELRNKRLDICYSCPDLIENDVCKHCFCYMPTKTGIENSYCPLRKW